MFKQDFISIYSKKTFCIIGSFTQKHVFLSHKCCFFYILQLTVLRIAWKQFTGAVHLIILAYFRCELGLISNKTVIFITIGNQPYNQLMMRVHI